MSENEVPNCDNICAFHKERDTLITEIGHIQEKHKGYWTFFFWGAAIVLSFMAYMTSDIRSSVKDISDTVNKMEQYIAVGEVNYRNNVMRLDKLEDEMGNVKIRLRVLETNHYEGD